MNIKTSFLLFSLIVFVISANHSQSVQVEITKEDALPEDIALIKEIKTPNKTETKIEAEKPTQLSKTEIENLPDIKALKKQKEIQKELENTKIAKEQNIKPKYHISDEQKKWLKTQIEKHDIQETKTKQYSIPPNMVQRHNIGENSHIKSPIFDHELMRYAVWLLTTDKNNENFNKFKTVFEKLPYKNMKDKHGNTVIFFAIKYNKNKFIKYLLSNGINTNLRNNAGIACINLAILKQNTFAIDQLISHGTDINIKDKNGNTPIYYAIHHQNFEAAEMLLQEKVKLNIKNNYNETPIDRAIQTNNLKIINLLKEYKTRPK